MFKCFRQKWSAALNPCRHIRPLFSLRLPLAALLALLFAPPAVHAVRVVKVSETVVEDSEEPFDRRIYAYAIDTDSAGNLHLLYAQPVPGASRCDIVYATGPSPTNLLKTVLEPNGALASISAAVLVDKTNDLVHVAYHKDSPAQLVHQTIQAGIPSAQHTVDGGGWHSKMQLDSNGNPLFVRESVDSLRLFLPDDDANDPVWTGINFAPSGTHAYRIADFVYDRSRGRFHVTYGDNASTLKGFPLHNLRYATSTNGSDWEDSVVNNSTSLWELEFWTSMVLDPSGYPAISTYLYNEYNGTYNTGTALSLQRFDGNAWITNRIAGYIPGQTPPDHRAGMGGQLHFDEAGILLGAWDNSPDRPIDFDGQYGNIAMDFSVEGGAWQSQFQVEPFSAEGYCRLASHRTNLYVLALGNFSNAKLYLVQLDIRRQWWWQASDMGNSWRWTSWFGFFTTYADPWIFHDAAHGWMYSPSFSPSSLWFWSADLGWLWTRDATYPYFWSKTRESWLWYNGAVNPRWFVDMTTDEWLSVP